MSPCWPRAAPRRRVGVHAWPRAEEPERERQRALRAAARAGGAAWDGARGVVRPAVDERVVEEAEAGTDVEPDRRRVAGAGLAAPTAPTLATPGAEARMMGPGSTTVRWGRSRSMTTG